MKHIYIAISLFLSGNSFSQIGSFDPTFNAGTPYSVSSYFSAGKVVILGNDSLLAISNGGFHSQDIANNYESAGLRKVINGNSTNSTSVASVNYQGKYSSFTDFVRLSDGKLIVAGWRRNEISDDGQLFVAKYNTDGSLDANFNSGSNFEYALTNAHLESRKIAVQPDGKIIISALKDYNRYVLIRLNANGTIDNTFGTNGVNTFYVHSGTGGQLNDLKILSNGKILIAGGDGDQANNYYLNGFVVRLNADGSGDNNFGLHGTLTVNFGDQGNQSEVKSIAFQSNGNLVIAGYGYATLPENAFSSQLAGINVYDSLGQNTYSSYLMTLKNQSLFTKVLCKSNDEIIAVGSGKNSNENTKILLAFFNSNGLINNSISTDGITEVEIPIVGGNVVDASFQADGKIIFTGGSYGSMMTNFMGNTYVGRLLTAETSNNGGGNTNGMNELTNNTIHVYPNPCQHQLNLVNLTDQHVNIVSITGKIVGTQFISNYKLDVSNLLGGTYFIQTQDGKMIRFCKE